MEIQDVDEFEEVARSAFEELMGYYYDCVENNDDDASVAELKSCIKDIYVRSGWTKRGRAFDLYEYSLELITEQEAEEDPELPVLYIKGTCHADGTFPVFNDPPRLFFAPRIQITDAEESEEELLQEVLDGINQERELHLSKPERMALLSIAYKFEYGIQAPDGDSFSKGTPTQLDSLRTIRFNGLRMLSAASVLKTSPIKRGFIRKWKDEVIAILPDFVFSRKVLWQSVISISEINLAIKIGSTRTGKVQNLAKYFIDCLEEKYGEPGESFKRIILEKHEIDPSAGEEYFAEVRWIRDFSYVNPTGEEFSKSEKMQAFFTQGISLLEPLEIDLDTERRAQLDKFNPAKLDGGV